MGRRFRGRGGQVIAMQKELLRNMIVKEIISMISSGVYKDGDRLPAERKLCQQFHVSRGTIRQALNDMEQLGILRVKIGSGAYVQSVPEHKIPTHYFPPDFQQTSLEDILLARKTIELAAVELACQNITPSQRKQLKAMIEAMHKSLKHLPDFLRYDMEFHQTLIEASGNRVLVTAFQAIYEYQKYSMILTSRQQGDEMRALEMHQKIYDALAAQDAEQCKNLIASHLDHMKQIPTPADPQSTFSSEGALPP